MTADVAGADGRRVVVVGRADVGLGAWVLDRVVAETLVVDGGLGVGSGNAVGEGGRDAVGEGVAGAARVGTSLLSEPPRKTEVTSAPPPQQSTSRPSMGSSITTRRRRSAG